MEKTKNYGIMGGTFNPIHNGHIYLAKKAYSQLGLDKILFIPNGNPPHKNTKDTTTATDRYNMVKTYVSGVDYFDCLDIEVKKETPSYTYETLTELEKIYEDANFFFIMGADSLFQFESWKNPDIIMKKATLVVAKRNNINYTDFDAKIVDLMEKFGGKIIPLEISDIPISSSDIRMKIANLEPVCDYVPSTVCEYILLKDLYKEYVCPFKSFKNLEPLKETLKKNLKPSRYVHTIAVADMAAALAMRYGEDVFKAYLAGLFHDYAKCMTDEELLNICEYNCININEFERHSPYLLHGKVAAFIAKKEYYVNDENILNAISYHTTGRVAMSLLEKILFVADYIEPYRDKAPNLTYIRKIAFENIDRSVSTILYSTLSYLASAGIPIDKTTQDAYNYYKN